MKKLASNLKEIVRFKKASKDFPGLVSQLYKNNNSSLIEPLWENFNDKIKNVFLPKPPINFLEDPTIRQTMFVEAPGKWLRAEEEYLSKYQPINSIANITRENYIGKPSITSDSFHTSHNSIHHYYHILRYENETKSPVKDYKTVVEWGGGYGNFAKIFRRLNPECTYIILDTPIFCAIQSLYLESVLREDHVNVMVSSTGKIKKGKVNIIPIGLVDKIKKLKKIDLFVSTWAISESSEAAQNMVIRNNMFKAKHILIGFQDSSKELPKASNTKKLAKLRKLKPMPIEFIPHNYYIFQ